MPAIDEAQNIKPGPSTEYRCSCEAASCSFVTHTTCELEETLPKHLSEPQLRNQKRASG